MTGAALDDATEHFAVVFEVSEVGGGIEGGFAPVGYCVSALSG